MTSSPAFESLIKNLKSVSEDIGSCVQKMQEDRFTLMQQLSDSRGMKLIPLSEYEDLLKRVTKSDADVAAEVQKQVTEKVSNLNTELKHRIEMERLTNISRIQTLEAKLELLQRTPPSSENGVTTETGGAENAEAKK